MPCQASDAVDRMEALKVFVGEIEMVLAAKAAVFQENVYR